MAWRSEPATARASARAGSVPVRSISRRASRRSNSSADGAGAAPPGDPAVSSWMARQAGELELQHGAVAVAAEVGGVVEGVAEEQAEHDHLALGARQPLHRRGRVPGRSGGPRRARAGGEGVAGHGDQPGGGLAFGAVGGREPAAGAVEDLAGQLGRLDAVAGPGEEVAVDALDLVVVDERERLPVAGGGAFEQGALARQLGRTFPWRQGQAGVWASGGRWGLRAKGGGGWRSAAEQELHRGREHDHDEQGGHDNGGPSSHAAEDSTRSGRSRERERAPPPWSAGPWPWPGSRAAPRAGPCGHRPRCGRRAPR